MHPLIISKVLYLGKYEKTFVTVKGDIVTLRYYNLAFNFSRFNKDGELSQRYRVLGIGYADNKRFAEFNKVFQALTGKPLTRPLNGMLVDFEHLGHKIEKGISDNHIEVYLLLKDKGSYSSIESISPYTGEPKIERITEMDFPKGFYEKYGLKVQYPLSFHDITANE